MFQRIDKKSAKEKLENTNSILVDIRDLASYEEGHISNAMHLTQENLAEFIASTEKSTPVLVICYHGNSSQTIAHYLTLQGFTDVYSIDGGYEEWIIG